MKVFWNKILKNALFLYCGIYTIMTIWNSVLYLAQGIEKDPNGNRHELDRAIVVLIGVLAFELCIHVKLKNRLVSALIAYVPTMLLTFGYVWLTGHYVELAKSAYRDIFINYTGAFVIVCVICNLVDMNHRKKTQKKIQ